MAPKASAPEEEDFSRSQQVGSTNSAAPALDLESAPACQACGRNDLPGHSGENEFIGTFYCEGCWMTWECLAKSETVEKEMEGLKAENQELREEVARLSARMEVDEVSHENKQLRQQLVRLAERVDATEARMRRQELEADAQAQAQAQAAAPGRAGLSAGAAPPMEIMVAQTHSLLLQLWESKQRGVAGPGRGEEDSERETAWGAKKKKSQDLSSGDLSRALEGLVLEGLELEKTGEAGNGHGHGNGNGHGRKDFAGRKQLQLQLQLQEDDDDGARSCSSSSPSSIPSTEEPPSFSTGPSVPSILSSARERRIPQQLSPQGTAEEAIVAVSWLPLLRHWCPCANRPL